MLFASAAVIVHFVPYLGDRGFSTATAAAIAGLIRIAALPGRLVFTPLGDRVPRGAVTASIFLLQAVSLLVLLTVQNVTGITVFVLLFGAGFGAVTPARAALMADIFGPARYASISGVMILFVTGARALGPVMAGEIHDLAGGYTVVFGALVASSTIAAGSVLIGQRAARASHD